MFQSVCHYNIKLSITKFGIRFLNKTGLREWHNRLSLQAIMIIMVIIILVIINRTCYRFHIHLFSTKNKKKYLFLEIFIIFMGIFNYSNKCCFKMDRLILLDLLAIKILMFGLCLIKSNFVSDVLGTIKKCGGFQTFYIAFLKDWLKRTTKWNVASGNNYNNIYNKKMKHIWIFYRFYIHLLHIKKEVFPWNFALFFCRFSVIQKHVCPW